MDTQIEQVDDSEIVKIPSLMKKDKLQNKVLARSEPPQYDNCSTSSATSTGSNHRNKSRSDAENGREATPERNDRDPVLVVKFLHDDIQHLHDVEINMDSVMIRVTPTSMKDCAKGFRKALELIQIVTKELERKIHEQGRQARQRDQIRECTAIVCLI